jgi:hypothetical protein
MWFTNRIHRPLIPEPELPPAAMRALLLDSWLACGRAHRNPSGIRTRGDGRRALGDEPPTRSDVELEDAAVYSDIPAALRASLRSR